jgi:hypothetical protein
VASTAVALGCAGDHLQVRLLGGARIFFGCDLASKAANFNPIYALHGE